MADELMSFTFNEVGVWGETVSRIIKITSFKHLFKGEKLSPNMTDVN
jgi:hypothetical protein